MILAVDGGLATFGWALVEHRTGAVFACGALCQKPNAKLGKHADRVRRAAEQARHLNGLFRSYLITELVAEQMSFAPRSSAAAKVGIALSWGNLIGLSEAHGAKLRQIPPKAWQRAIVPPQPGEDPTAAIDYERVFAALSSYVDARATRLDQVPKSQRNHALDAVGVGVYAALRPEAGGRR